LFGGDGLIYGGLATLAFGAIGMLASQQVRRLAAFSLIISSGTLLAATGFGHAALVGAALFYLLGSTLAVSALFLLGELIERFRQSTDAPPPIHDGEAASPPFYVEAPDAQAPANLDDEEVALIGKAIPAGVAFLGLTFIASALLIAGLPPFPGFLAKFAMASAVLLPSGGHAMQSGSAVAPEAWALLILLLVSSLLSTIALSRAGIRYFWTPQGRQAPRPRIIECLPIAALLLACTALAIEAGPVLRYTRAAADGVLDPAPYIGAIMSATPVPGPARAQQPLLGDAPP
jgi:multicomponent K+:H+ antiporter subunit D